MARIPRVSDSDFGEEVRAVDVWKARLIATLQKAERLASLYREARSSGNDQWARNYYKHARKEAREASKMLGVLEIEFGAGMAQEVERARKVYVAIAPATVS